jgi:hypothetical protein
MESAQKMTDSKFQVSAISDSTILSDSVSYIIQKLENPGFSMFHFDSETVEKVSISHFGHFRI